MPVRLHGGTKQVVARLQDFYSGNNHRFQKHQWDMERARKAEYQIIADRLLGAVGGSIGRRKEITRYLVESHRVHYRDDRESRRTLKN